MLFDDPPMIPSAEKKDLNEADCNQPHHLQLETEGELQDAEGSDYKVAYFRRDGFRR